MGGKKKGLANKKGKGGKKKGGPGEPEYSHGMLLESFSQSYFESSAKDADTTKVEQESSDGDGGLLRKEPELNEDIKLVDMKTSERKRKNL